MPRSWATQRHSEVRRERGIVFGACIAGVCFALVLVLCAAMLLNGLAGGGEP